MEENGEGTMSRFAALMKTPDRARQQFLDLSPSSPRLGKLKTLKRNAYTTIATHGMRIDLWSHREGAPGLSQMYLRYQADKSSYSNIQLMAGGATQWSMLVECICSLFVSCVYITRS